MKSPELLKNAWAVEPQTVSRHYEVDPSRGLDSSEAASRLAEHGENRITRLRHLRFRDILKEELTEPMILLLVAIGIMYSVWGQIGDTITIILVIVAVTMAEVLTEYRAKKSIESLRTLAQPESWVLRDGMALQVDTTHIVPGDVLLLKAGIKVGADARLIVSAGIEVNESQLTGESAAVSKSVAALPDATGLNDRRDMVFMGSTIVRGCGRAVVTATGMKTEVGKIAGLTEEEREPKTPLQKSMKQLSKSLIWIAVAVSVLVPVIGALRGMPLKDMILTGLSLAYATIPEEMPIIVTMLLGLGAISLSKNGVLIRRTKAAETLGSVTVIATDKTGTLTENAMRIKSWYARDERELFTVASLMADVDLASDGSFLGDPMDGAVVEKAKAMGLGAMKGAMKGAAPYMASDMAQGAIQNEAQGEAQEATQRRPSLAGEFTLVRDHGFDEEKRLFTSEWLRNGSRITLVKGAPESVAALAPPRSEAGARLAEAIRSGCRTIAFAMCDTDLGSAPGADIHASSGAAIQAGSGADGAGQPRYRFVGFVCFEDPVRSDVPEAIASCSRAGVRVIMITGDHPSTALKVAQEAGIDTAEAISGDEIARMSGAELRRAVGTYSVFARISPEQKLAIVEALRANGEVVAVTGDGINDAPALKAADIGISMGLSGTDVAKEAADMILTKDSLAPLPAAIAEGRRLYDNLSKCVKYYLACKVGLVLSFLVCVAVGSPMPFSPVQIIILELFMDLAASSSFVMERPESDVLQRKPRDPKKNFMDGAMMRGLFSGALTLSCAVLVTFFVSLSRGAEVQAAQTNAFIMWLFCHVCLAFTMRTDRVPISEVGVFSSKYFNTWMLGVILFLAVALLVPVLRNYLKLAPVNLSTLLLIALGAIAMTSWLEIRKKVLWYSEKSGNEA